MSDAQDKAIDPERLQSLAAVLLGKVVTSQFPGTRLVGSEFSEVGFSYDFLLPKGVHPPETESLELALHQAARESGAVESIEMMRENAAEYFSHHDQPYRAEWLHALDVTTLSLVRIDGFIDLCPLPHLTDCSVLRAFKILKSAIATRHLPVSGEVKVWRVQGVAFGSKRDLKEFLKRAERAKQCDHRRLGEELRLFRNNDETGAGLWMWLPNGTAIREQLIAWWKREHSKQQFSPVVTPRFVKEEQLKQSRFHAAPGQTQRLFPSLDIEGSNYFAAPSNSPGHALLFKGDLHSYRELPVRYCELGELYYHGNRHDLYGLCRARAYLADDVTIFCTQEQVRNEIISSLRFIMRTIRIFGFRYQLSLVLRDYRFAGTVKRWDIAANWMQEALDELDVVADVRSGAFSGPRVEVILFDALGRRWNGPSLEVNFNLPERYGLRYQGADDRMHTPWMVSRSLFGSLERFIALLVEHYEGNLPAWLAPQQVRLIPVNDSQAPYLQEVGRALRERGFRISFDERKDSLSARIHRAEGERIPFVVVAGEREMKAQVLTVRDCRGREVKEGVTVRSLLEMLDEQLHLMSTDPDEQGESKTL